MSTPDRPAASPEHLRALLDHLHELIAALDRRVPHLERDGEEAIARDAVRLRTAALARIEEIHGALQTPLRIAEAGEGEP